MATIADGTGTTTEPTGLADEEREPRTGDTAWPGGITAALMACGIGSAIFGVAVAAAEAIKPIKEVLTLHQGVGPLSGKAAVGSAAYLLGWLILHLALRRRMVSVRVTLWVTLATLVVGLVLTFPPVYQSIAGR